MSCKPDILLTNKMWLLYEEGKSLSDVGKHFGITRQAVFKRFKRAELKMRTKKNLHKIRFNHNDYTLRPNGYMARTDAKRSYLHRDMWEKIICRIPLGWDIHHINEDKLDNRIKNLCLIHKSAHTWIHNGWKK